MKSQILISKIYQAQSVSTLAQAAFHLISLFVPSRLMSFTVGPQANSLHAYHAFLSNPAFAQLATVYRTGHFKKDLWLKRSPSGPGFKVVRHSDHTPPTLLRKSCFYRNILTPIRAEYGASIAVWNNDTWLGYLTLYRSARDGDFTAEHLEHLKMWHVHFSTALHRLAREEEMHQAADALENVIKPIPQPILVLCWNLKVVSANMAAREACITWIWGAESRSLKLPQDCPIPRDLLGVLCEIKTDLMHRFSFDVSRRDINHPRQPLQASIQFMPSVTYGLHHGTFIITFRSNFIQEPMAFLCERFAALTRRERECLCFAREGLSNKKIAQVLGTSHHTVRNQMSELFRKLGICKRYELIAMFSRIPSELALLHLK
jgi:DNA-binding CsgD family transcriptional regulator